ncbi:MAG: LCP family protein [Clostridiaceae bacterium]|nr:LCP family protein [Clostridiaceae bacterium]
MTQIEGASKTRKTRSAIGRLYPLKFVALGVVSGLFLSLFIGFYAIYADMMSRITYENPQVGAFQEIQDLTDTDFFLEYEPELQGLMEDDFDQLQYLIDGDQADPQQAAPDQQTASTSKPAVNIPLKTMNGIENILLFGIDTGSYRGRSDVTMIISINHNTKQINIVSLMRAMYVKIGIPRHDWGLLNAAYSYGGPRLAIKTVERNFGIPITGFVAINFNSFVRIIDAIDGVGITLTSSEAAYLNFPEGYNRFNGQQALAYARLRKIDSDFQRNQRQRNVINCVINEMASQGAASVYKVATVVLANTYTNLDLNRYISKAPSYLSYGRRQLQIPAWSETNRYYSSGQEVWRFDMVKTHNRLVSFLTN